MENKFKKGLILGGILAAGAALVFSMTKEGQQLTEELQKDLKDLTKLLKKSLNKLEDITKESFDDLVTTVVIEYAKKKELAIDAQKKLINALQATWQEVEKEYQSGKAEDNA